MNLRELEIAIQNKSLTELLVLIDKNYGNEAVFSTSLGIEDQILTHAILNSSKHIQLFTLDTGRLFNETYSLLSATQELCNNRLTVFYPSAIELENYVTKNGINAFYNSIELRKTCCQIRKVEPLQRALKNKKIWITGLRAEQSNNRSNMPMVEYDEQNNIIKIHPLLNYSYNNLLNYVKNNNVQINPLHDKGYVSIGCQPCTRAIKEGEDFRAGRWWWEETSKKECGLHK